MRWLVSELDYRDGTNPLNDISTGAYLGEMERLSQSHRQLREDSDMHVELDLIGDFYQVVKCVRKRPAERMNGEESYFYYDREGKKIPVSEEEFDRLIGIHRNKEDILEQEENEVMSLDSQHDAPLDKWDIVFDLTEVIKEQRKFVAICEKSEKKIDPNWARKLLQGMAEAGTYSANWYPYPKLNKLSHYAKQVVKKIEENDLSHDDMMIALGYKFTDKRNKQLELLQKKFDKMPLGKEKAKLAMNIQRLKKDVFKANQTNNVMITQNERNTLWSIWRENQIKRHGKVKMTKWHFENALKTKLIKEISAGRITVQEAEMKLSKAIEQNFGKKDKAKIENKKETIKDYPEWIEKAQSNTQSEQQEEFDFAGGDWFENQQIPECELFLTEEE